MFLHNTAEKDRLQFVAYSLFREGDKMKKQLFVCCILLFVVFGNACKDKESININKDEVNLETDDNFCTSDLRGFAKTEKGYYYWKDELLYFYDAASGKETVLCSNANCKHNSSDCDAYYSLHGDCIFYYQNNLYLIQEFSRDNHMIDFNLMKISEDGSKRTTVLTLFQGKDNTSIGCEAMIHRGYCYFYQDNFDAEKEVENSLYRVALKQGAKPEKILSTKGYGVTYYMFGYKQNLYIQTSMFSDSTYAKLINTLRVYQIETGEVTDYELSDFRRLYIVKDILYYLKDSYIWKMEEGKEPEKFYDLEGDILGKLWFDGTYFYFDNWSDCQIKEKDASERKVLVLDTKGKKVDEFPVELQYEFLGGDSQRLFWFDYYMLDKVCVFDTKQIGTDTHDLEEVQG